MSELPRLNRVISALEKGHAFVTFSTVDIDTVLAYGTSQYDGLIFELEHATWNGHQLRDGLQYLLNRRQIAQAGSLVPAVTPMVRIPPNGGEMNQFFAKQALDLGVYGVVWPHVSTVAQAYNAVSACRYPRLKSAPLYEPAGQRGDGPGTAVRYWGVTQAEYYARADVWPLAPQGEVLVTLMIEDIEGIANLDDMLTNVPGIGAILIGEGDLSQELGYPRQYEHPEVLGAMAKVVETCRKHGVPVGHPHVDSQNVERVIAEGYRLLMPGATRSYAALEKGLKLAGRG